MYYRHFEAETNNEVLIFESAPSFRLLASSEFANELRGHAHINLDISSSFLFVDSFNDSVHHNFEMARTFVVASLQQQGA